MFTFWACWDHQWKWCIFFRLEGHSNLFFSSPSYCPLYLGFGWLRFGLRTLSWCIGKCRWGQWSGVRNCSVTYRYQWDRELTHGGFAGAEFLLNVCFWSSPLLGWQFRDRTTSDRFQSLRLLMPNWPISSPYPWINSHKCFQPLDRFSSSS